MPDHEIFDQQKEVNSFHAHKSRLSIENPEWTEAMVYKQALIDFNTMMYPNQVKSYFSEKNGDKVGYVNQAYRIIDGDLFDPYYGFFQAMINYETTEIGRASLKNFRQAAISALPGQTIPVLDMSGLGIGRGVKYLDTYVKDENNLIKHKGRVDLTADGPDLTIEQAQEFLTLLEESPVMLPVEQFQVFPEIMPVNSFPEMQFSEPAPVAVGQPVEQQVKPEESISMVATTGFWFGMAVAEAVPYSITETVMPVFEAAKTTLGLEPEVTPMLAAIAVKPEAVVQASVELVSELITARSVAPKSTGIIREKVRLVETEVSAETGVMEKPVAETKPPAVAAVKTTVRPELKPKLVVELPEQEDVARETDELAPMVVAVAKIPEPVAAKAETVRIETLPHEEVVEEKITVSQVNRDETVLPIWEIRMLRMQGISLDDIPEWNLSSVLVGEDLGWSMTVPGLKAERELGTNAERAFKLGKWPEFDYLKKTAEVVETILSVIVNTNWEQPPLLRRRMVKDFGGDWGSGSAKYRQIQR